MRQLGLAMCAAVSLSQLLLLRVNDMKLTANRMRTSRWATPAAVERRPEVPAVRRRPDVCIVSEPESASDVSDRESQRGGHASSESARWSSDVRALPDR